MKNPYPTLKQIQELLLANNKILVASFDKDYKHLESSINLLDDKVENFRTEVNKRFDKIEKKVDEGFEENYDSHQELISAIDEMADRKMNKHCQKYHGVVV